MKTRAVVFDLDGTLADSRLDYGAMRRELGLPPQTPMLEAIARLTDSEAIARAHAILLRHELDGARRATPMPGAGELLASLRAARLKLGVFTRNARQVAELTLGRLDMAVDMLVAREDAPPKPEPDGLLRMMAAWQLAPEDLLYVGDYRFDVEAGRRAGVRTVLFAPEPPDFEHDADHVIDALMDVLVHLK